MQPGEAIARAPLRSPVVRTQSIVGGTATALLAVAMTLSGISFVIGPAPVVAGLRHLGYPDYVRTLLGVAKLLGVAALVLPSFPRLREWAYAGFSFVLTGAIVSHLASREPAKVVPAVAVLSLLVTSYVLRRRSTGAERRGA
jgi:hypothetical protein